MGSPEDRVRILILEDDVPHAEATLQRLRAHGHEPRRETTSLVSLRICYAWQPHLVIIDASQPDSGAWLLVERLRELADMPILLLTAASRDADRIRGLQLGADDCISRDTSPEELLLRIEALLRRIPRGTPPAYGSRAFALGDDLVVDPSGRRVIRKGQPVALTRTELSLLLALVARAGETLSHEDLLEAVWGPEFRDKIDQLKLAILRLRRKVEPGDGAPTLIVSDYGLGYRLAQPPGGAVPEP